MTPMLVTSGSTFEKYHSQHTTVLVTLDAGDTDAYRTCTVYKRPARLRDLRRNDLPKDTTTGGRR